MEAGVDMVAGSALPMCEKSFASPIITCFTGDAFLHTSYPSRTEVGFTEILALVTASSLLLNA